MTGVNTYSTTPASNVNANTGINWDEGMSPGAVNNSSRQNMTDLRNFANDLIWFQYGSGTSPVVTPAYVASTQFKIAGVDVSIPYHVGRRVKAVGSGTGTIYGSISAVSFSTDTTVTVVWDSGSLTNETLTVYLSQAPVTGNPIPGPKVSTRQVLTSGSAATYTTPANVRQLRIRMLGGGGSGAQNSAAGGDGNTGGTTTFNSITAIGGGGGSHGANGGGGGTGGTGGSSPTTWRTPGNSGGCGQFGAQSGGNGGAGTFGGAAVNNTSAAANTGAGGGGAASASGNSGGGGGSGEYVEIIISSPAATYTYTVGAGGTSGGTGSGAGGSGIIIVDEIY